MFGLFKKKSEIEKLEASYDKMMEEGMHIQRSGDLKKYAFHMEKAEQLLTKIEALRQLEKK